jgi:hypothetical protein
MRQKRKLNPATMQNIFCYTSDELQAYIKGNIAPEKRAKIVSHLNFEQCSRCRRIFKLLENNSVIKSKDKQNNISSVESDIFGMLKNKMEQKTPAPIPFKGNTNIEKGQIWTTSPKPKNMQGQQLMTVDAGIPVLIIDSGNNTKHLNNIIRVIPISFDTEFHFPGETLVFDKHNPLRIKFLLEVFNECPMLAGNLCDCRGVFSQTDITSIEKAKQKFYLTIDDKENSTHDNYQEQELDDPEYRQWKEREIEIINYLILPVNENIWNEETEIQISQYKKAADSDSRNFPEKKAVLLDNDDSSLVVLQKRDELFIRYESTTITPDRVKVKINGQNIEMIISGFNQYDYTVGRVEQISEYVDIEIELNKETFNFNLKTTFQNKNGSK